MAAGPAYDVVQPGAVTLLLIPTHRMIPRMQRDFCIRTDNKGTYFTLGTGMKKAPVLPARPSAVNVWIGRLFPLLSLFVCLTPTNAQNALQDIWIVHRPEQSSGWRGLGGGIVPLDD